MSSLIKPAIKTPNHSYEEQSKLFFIFNYLIIIKKN